MVADGPRWAIGILLVLSATSATKHAVSCSSVYRFPGAGHEGCRPIDCYKRARGVRSAINGTLRILATEAPVQADSKPRLAVLERTIIPQGPYSLADSARHAGDATRRFRDGSLTLTFETDAQPALARVSQRTDGRLSVRIEGTRSPEALEWVRFMLAVDDDHTPFLHRFSRDKLLGAAISRRPGMRPLRCATMTHALLKAVCGQLIQAKEAKRLERRLLGLASPEHDDFRLPPNRSTFAGFSPAQLARVGLVSRKSTTFIRLSRNLDLEKLRRVSTDVAVSRITEERGLGPWSAGVICLYGLGRFEHGLIGDLGLIKLCSVLMGKWAEPEDTRELLAPYGDWAGLASIYLLAGTGKGTTRAANRARFGQNA